MWVLMGFQGTTFIFHINGLSLVSWKENKRKSVRERKARERGLTQYLLLIQSNKFDAGNYKNIPGHNWPDGFLLFVIAIDLLRKLLFI